MKTSFLIIGSSGMVGSKIVERLRSEGHLVRETTSRKDNVNDQRVYVNIATGEGVHQAFEGIERAFLISPPGYADQYQMLAPLIQEAKRRSLKRVVLMTAMGANAVDSTPFRRAELDLERSGLDYNIIRPNWFLQNFNTFWLQGIKEQGEIALPAGTAKVSFIDARDIAAVAATLLTTDTFKNRDFDLTGAQAVDHSEVAALLGDALKKSVVYKDIAPEILQNGLVGAGLPADYVAFMITIFGFLREGYNARTTNAVEEITGSKPRSVQNYITTYRSAWL